MFCAELRPTDKRYRVQKLITKKFHNQFVLLTVHEMSLSSHNACQYILETCGVKHLPLAGLSFVVVRLAVCLVRLQVLLVVLSGSRNVVPTVGTGATCYDG